MPVVDASDILCASQLVGLSRQDTLLTNDPTWTKSESACVPGIPTPIPPRNEPYASISAYIMPVVDASDIDSSCSQTLQPTESIALA